jgi:hypothetical protein
MNREIATINDTTEEIGGRLALAEVSIDQLTTSRQSQHFKFETTMTKKIEEIMQDQDNRHERNRK